MSIQRLRKNDVVYWKDVVDYLEFVRVSAEDDVSFVMNCCEITDLLNQRKVFLRGANLRSKL
jgi:hypothetical protein